MEFDQRKKAALRKMAGDDRSKKGSVDAEIKDLVEAINSHNDFYTTSSCAGRVVLLGVAPSKKKNEAQWLYITHGKPSAAAMWSRLSDLEDGNVWLKQESPILHISARNLDAAQRMMGWARESGLKHSGIMSIKPRIMLEIMSSERVEIPVFQDRLLVSKKFFFQAVGICSTKLGMSRDRTNLLLKIIGKK